MSTNHNEIAEVLFNKFTNFELTNYFSDVDEYISHCCISDGYAVFTISNGIEIKLFISPKLNVDLVEKLQTFNLRN